MTTGQTSQRSQTSRSRSPRAALEVVKNVSFDVAPGEIFGIVGESGSGKTLATRAIIALLPPAIKVTGGQVTLQGTRRAVNERRRSCAICAARKSAWSSRSR